MTKTKWVFIIYKIPNTPSSKRVYVWRKLKRLGALALQDAIFAMPYSEKTLEQFHWLAAEIIEMDGEAEVWESYATTNAQEKSLVDKFNDNMNSKYAEIIEKLKKITPNESIDEKETLLRSIIKEYMEIKYRDYFGADLATQIDKILSREKDYCMNLRMRTKVSKSEVG
jgi:DNA-binding transcriptional regulator PaaX